MKLAKLGSSIAGEVAGTDRPVRSWALDLADKEAVARTIPEVAARFGGIDVLANNAGSGTGGPVDGGGYEDNGQRALLGRERHASAR